MSDLKERLDHLARWHDDEHDTIWAAQQRLEGLERLTSEVDRELTAGRPLVAHVLIRTWIANE